MISKKHIIILASALVVSFALSFVLSWLFGKSAPSPQAPEAAAAAPKSETPEQATQGPAATMLASLPAHQKPDIRLKEQQLDDLLRELRRKLQQVAQQEEQLQRQEERLRIAQDLLKQQAKELEDLQMQLVNPINHLKELLAEIKRTQVTITQQEAENLRRVATIYDKMDSTSSSEILTQMCANSQMDDAVKLLSFMSEKKAAKTLSEMQDKALAAKLSEKLKSVKVEG